MSVWRVGGKVPLNVYEGDRPVCQCHTAEDAARIITAMNSMNPRDLHIIEYLKVSCRPYKALKNAGLDTIEQVSIYGRKRLLALPNCGEISVNAIAEELTRFGWELHP